jgi:hypothetical protein
MSTLAFSRTIRGVERAIGCLVALITGGVAGAAVAHWHSVAGPLVPLAVIGTVLAVAVAVLGRTDRSSERVTAASRSLTPNEVGSEA